MTVAGLLDDDAMAEAADAVEARQRPTWRRGPAPGRSPGSNRTPPGRPRILPHQSDHRHRQPDRPAGHSGPVVDGEEGGYREIRGDGQLRLPLRGTAHLRPRRGHRRDLRRDAGGGQHRGRQPGHDRHPDRPLPQAHAAARPTSGIEARCIGREGRKIRTWAGMYHGDVLTAEADGIFIEVVARRIWPSPNGNADADERRSGHAGRPSVPRPSPDRVRPRRDPDPSDRPSDVSGRPASAARVGCPRSLTVCGTAGPDDARASLTVHVESWRAAYAGLLPTDGTWPGSPSTSAPTTGATSIAGLPERTSVAGGRDRAGELSGICPGAGPARRCRLRHLTAGAAGHALPPSDAWGIGVGSAASTTPGWRVWRRPATTRRQPVGARRPTPGPGASTSGRVGAARRRSGSSSSAARWSSTHRWVTAT